MASAKRQRHRARRALGRPGPPPAAASPTPRKRTVRPCQRCGERCRTDKPLYGWVCANSVYELDRYFVFWLGIDGGDVLDVLTAYLDGKSRGTLSPPGPRGPGVNVRKPMGPGCTRWG